MNLQQKWHIINRSSSLCMRQLIQIYLRKLRRILNKISSCFVKREKDSKNVGLRRSGFVWHDFQPRRAYYTRRTTPHRGKCKCRASIAAAKSCPSSCSRQIDDRNHRCHGDDDLLTATPLIDRYHARHYIHPANTRRGDMPRRPTNNNAGCFANKVSSWPDTDDTRDRISSFHFLLRERGTGCTYVVPQFPCFRARGIQDTSPDLWGRIA